MLIHEVYGYPRDIEDDEKPARCHISFHLTHDKALKKIRSLKAAPDYYAEWAELFTVAYSVEE